MSPALRSSGGQGRRRKLSFWRLGLVLAGAVAMTGAGLATGIVVRAAAAMPSLADPLHHLGQTSLIYDLNGHLIGAVPGGQRRQVVPLSAIPPVVQHAFVAVEDKRFYQNEGFDLRSIFRAAVADLTGHPLQGGSTITEQLAKNLYLTPSDTLTRKVKEAWLGIEIARRYTKAEILDRYLNWIYLGQNAYGVEAASETYFGVPIQQATAAEAALLAGLAQAPSAYDPVVHPQAARARRDTALTLMEQQGYITAAQERAAAASPVLPARPTTKAKAAAVHSGAAAPPPADAWFVDAVIRRLEQQDHLSAQQVVDGGLRIYTTLRPSVQAAAEQAIANLSRYKGPFALTASPMLQAAEAVINPLNGDVVALVGGRRYQGAMAFDRALQAERQPGSSIKPLVDYVPALMHGLTAGTAVDDAVETFGSGSNTYTPTNYDHLYYGLTTLTEALRRSVNVVAVKVLNRVGVETGLHNAVRMGLPLTQNDAHLALALGGTTDCCTPLDMARAYSTIANGGYRVRARLITKVVGPSGQVLVSNPVHMVQAIPANVAYVMTKMLETVDEPQPNVGWDVLSGKLDSNWGTGYDATVHDNVPGWPTAAKTGTSNSNRDAWYVGFTPSYAAAVWIGYDQPKPLPGLYGGVYAGPIFRQTMEAALAGLKPHHFRRPQGVVTSPIDIKAAPWTVALPGPLTPSQDVRREWFVAGTQPTVPNTLWVQRQVTDTTPPLLWQPACGGTPKTTVFLNRPIDTPAWAKGMAARIGTATWQSLIPIDMNLAPPTQSCLGGTAGAPAAGSAGAPGTAGPPGTAAAPAGSPGCTIPSGSAPETCVLTLTAGQAPAPAVIEAVAGRPLRLAVHDRQGLQLLVVGGLGVRQLLRPGQRTTIVATPRTPGTYAILDISLAGTRRAELIVTAPAAPAAGTAGPAPVTGGGPPGSSGGGRGPIGHG